MYGKDRKQYRSSKLTCVSDVPFTLILWTMLTQSFDTLEEVQISVINSLSAKKRKQLYSKVFERFLVKGVRRKVFVPWSVKGSHRSAQFIRRQPAFGLMQSCLCSHYPFPRCYASISFFAQKLLLALGILWLSRGLLRGAPRMSGSVSYTVAWIRLKCSASGLGSPCSLYRSHCFISIQVCQEFVVNLLTKLE